MLHQHICINQSLKTCIDIVEVFSGIPIVAPSYSLTFGATSFYCKQQRSFAQIEKMLISCICVHPCSFGCVYMPFFTLCSSVFIPLHAYAFSCIPLHLCWLLCISFLCILLRVTLFVLFMLHLCRQKFPLFCLN